MSDREHKGHKGHKGLKPLVSFVFEVVLREYRE
jgi:hypothetical protein